MRAAWATAVPDVVRRVIQRAGASTWRRYSRTQSTRTVILRAIIGLLFVQMSVGASAFSPSEHPSFSLKVFGYDAVIFYRPQVGQGGLSTTVWIDHNQEPKVTAATVEAIQKRADKAEAIELIYNPESAGSGKVDLLAQIPAAKLFSVNIAVQLQRAPVVGEVGNRQIVAAVEKLSDDPDRSHFDKDGYQVLDQPVVNFVMQRKLYSRPDGRPLFFFRRPISSKDHIYTMTGSFLLGAHARVLYSFATDKITKEHWVEVDKAVLAFVTAVLKPPQ